MAMLPWLFPLGFAGGVVVVVHVSCVRVSFLQLLASLAVNVHATSLLYSQRPWQGNFLVPKWRLPLTLLGLVIIVIIITVFVSLLGPLASTLRHTGLSQPLCNA